MSEIKMEQKYDQDKITEQLLQSVSEAYLNPPEGFADKDGHMKINELASEFAMTWIKIRKLLITAGVYENPVSIEINRLKSEGKSVKEIQDITGLSSAAISGYLPYQKTIYNLEQQSELAERLKRYRKRKKAVENLSAFLKSDVVTGEAKELLWETLLLFQGYLFHTVKGKSFCYEVKGNEIFFNRKEKSVTKSTVNMAFEKVMDLQKEGIVITGPKKIGCFGDSYLYPVFIRFGIIHGENTSL